ncbi:WD repeat-containing protein 65 [Phytophthora cinnamomi]|uniref:WD repeat-containing protein 65 n=1 Tax=Phytophthora cinnamomi TaxID=4785 RepID=UPI00355A7756|nr:WD repeat-containing protein 65 [Phytophthora cinnamomi]
MDGGMDAEVNNGGSEVVESPEEDVTPIVPPENMDLYTSTEEDKEASLHLKPTYALGFRSCGRTVIDFASEYMPSHVRMECVTAHGKGFVLGGSAGFFSIYEASDDAKDPFPFVRSVSVGDIAFDCITISPNSETIVASSKSRELITFSMSAIDTEQEDRIEYREFIRHGHQVGPILQVDEMENKDAKIRTLLHEVKALRQSSLKKEYSVGEMTREFTRLAQFTNYKDLESAVKDAYKVYVMGETLHKKPPRAIISSNNNNTPGNTTTPLSPGGGGFYSPAKTVMTLHAKATNMHQKQHASTPTATASASATPKTIASAVSDEALGYDCKQSVDESVKQMEYMSRTIQTLRTALDHAKTQADRVRRDSVAEGSMLIDECNRLRKENKLLQIQIRNLKRSLYIAGGGTGNGNDNGEGERGTGFDSSRSHQLLSSPQLSRSSPQLHARPSSPDQAPQLDLTLDVTSGSGGPVSLAPLHSGRATPSKQQRRQRTPSYSSSPSPSRSSSSLLPFGRLERGRHNAARTDELASVVEKQKRDIQRLQTQVQLLLSGAADAPLVQHYAGATRMMPLSPSASSQALASLDTSRGAMSVSRIGTLRPLPAAQTSAPLQSSFVLMAPDFPPAADLPETTEPQETPAP